MLTLFLFTAYSLLFTASHAQAQTVDLLWQGEGYVPPFYKGRTLWSTQAKITLVAIPHISGSNPSRLFYKWEQNGTVLGKYNDIGKRTLSFYDPILGQAQNIQVEILSGDGVPLAQTSLNVTPINPSLLIYENNPLLGFLFNQEIGSNFNLREKEVTFTMFPLFFNPTSRFSSGMSYEWRTNSGAVETRNSVTYRAPDNASGSSKISVSAKNEDQVTQSVRRNFTVMFGNNNAF